MAMSDHVKGKYDEAAAMGDIKEKAADAVEDLKEKMHKDSDR